MTAINLAIAGDPITSENKRNIAQCINDAFLNVEVGTHNTQLRRGFLTMFESIEPDDIWIGTDAEAIDSDSRRAVLVTIRVMAGPWNSSMKQRLIKEIDDILRRELNMPLKGRGDDIWITFLEVPDGAWGVGGRQISIGALAPVFAEEQKARISSYLSRLESEKT